MRRIFDVDPNETLTLSRAPASLVRRSRHHFSEHSHLADHRRDNAPILDRFRSEPAVLWFSIEARPYRMWRLSRSIKKVIVIKRGVNLWRLFTVDEFNRR